jgi:hypothetical protein
MTKQPEPPKIIRVQMAVTVDVPALTEDDACEAAHKAITEGVVAAGNITLVESDIVSP